MAYRETYTDAEWQTLQFTPMWAFTAIAMADGKVDDAEFQAFLKEISDAPIYKSALVREVLLSILVDFAKIAPAYKADTRTVVQGIREGGILLGKVDADQASMFKAAVMAIASKVAEASGGMFGPKASQQEKEAWATIGLLLGFNMKESNEALARV